MYQFQKLNKETKKWLEGKKQVMTDWLFYLLFMSWFLCQLEHLYAARQVLPLQVMINIRSIPLNFIMH